MALVKRSTCSKCGKGFSWQIERPGDSYWNRWVSDKSTTLSAWWQTHNLCWDHAFEQLPDEFVPRLKTIRYEESEQGPPVPEESNR